MRKELLPKFAFLFFLFQTLVSCGSGGQDASVPEYYQQVRRIMVQNGELSTGFERLTNSLFTGAESEDAASALQNEIIPLSTQLATSVSGVTTANPTIAATHAYIVDGWTQRKEAYMEMLQAYRSSDIALFDSATQKAATARQNEERYFLEINAFLAPYGLYITQHPE